MNPPQPTSPFTIQWAISSRECWIWTDWTFYLNGSCSTINYRKISYGSLESGHVIYVVFISFLYILLVLSHGLIGVKVPGSTCKGV